MAIESATGVAATLRAELAAEVRRRAGNECEYCRLPQKAFRRPFHIEHIVAKQHGGQTRLENLALACWRCNLKKGPNLTGIDPDSRTVVALFHPRNDRWSDHFGLTVSTGDPSAADVKGLTPIGRATVQVLGINEQMRRVLRYELWREGLFPARA